jgi:hypothetical protein
MTDSTSGAAAAREPSRQSAQKQALERAIFDSVYEEGSYVTVSHTDVPDFVVTTDSGSFGVEVTETYADESEARSINIPSYTRNLLAGEPHRHRDDVAALNVVTVQITKPDGSVVIESSPAVLRFEPTPQEHGKRLAATVAAKNARAADYVQGLTHVNLIVLDHHLVKPDEPDEYSSREYLVPELRAALTSSPFREVYILTHTGSGRAIYRPLQALLATEDLFLFAGAFANFEDGKLLESLTSDDLMVLYALCKAGTEMDVDIYDLDGYVRAGYRGNAIRFEPGEGLSNILLGDGDQPPRHDATPPLAAHEIEKLKRHFADFSANNEFISELGIDVANPWPGLPESDEERGYRTFYATVEPDEPRAQ